MDPMQRIASPDAPLFAPHDTRAIAGSLATRRIPSRRALILDLLRTRGPLCLWELAREIGVHDHQVSGRITELLRDGMIYRTGQTRPTPQSGSPADVYSLTPHAAEVDLAESLGYPATISIDNQLYRRDPRRLDDQLAGVPYSADTSSGHLRLSTRLYIVVCPTCSEPLQSLIQDGQKLLTCRTPTCAQRWKARLAHEPGKPDVLVLTQYP